MVDAGADHFLGKGVLRKVTQRRETINDTMFTEGDIAIAIQWYDRCVVPGTADNDDGLDFERWVSDNDNAGAQDIINSTELRAASSTPFDNGLHFTMALVPNTIVPAFRPAVTPAVTRTGRSAAVVAAAAAVMPDDAIYRIPDSVDHEIRKGSWLGGRYM